MRRHIAMITGLWANSNYDTQKEGEPAPRIEALQTLERQLMEAVDEIYSGRKRVEKGSDIDIKNDPFFRAMRIPTLPIDADEAKIAQYVANSEAPNPDYEGIDQY
jgi:hypothetical protein